MLNAFTCEAGRTQRLADAAMAERLRHTVWIDLLSPTLEESRAVEQATGLAVPTEAELSEIESSSRLAVRDGALYLSMPLIRQADTGARQVPVGFVLTAERLITVRFAPSVVFDSFAAEQQRGGSPQHAAPHMLAGLLEAIVDRQADALEQIRADLDAISHRIFRDAAAIGGRKREDAMLRDTLTVIGRTGDLVSHIRDTLLGAGRIVPYVESMAAAWLPKDLRPRLLTLKQDIASLNDFDTHLSDKVQFLLDATLGLINMAQNNVMKVLTVASVVGIPPTLIAGIYGMNFKNIHEYDWAWGYEYGLAVIVLTALVPLVWFKLKGWL